MKTNKSEKETTKFGRSEQQDVFVTSVKQIDLLFVISGITNKGKILVNSYKKFRPGEYIQFYGTIKEEDGIREMVATGGETLEDKRAKKEIDKFIESQIKIHKVIPFYSDEIIKKLAKGFDKTAKEIAKALFLHRPIIVRHHNDTDGISSGLAIYFAIGNAKNVKIISNKYPTYRMIEAQQDVEMVHQLDADYLPPLLVIFDLGSSIDSFDTYDYVKKAGFEIIIADHHPPSEGLEEHVDLVVSAHLVGGVGSAYTAGLLSAEISQRLAKIDFHDLPFIAMVGDRSSLKFEKKDSYLRYAIALDYLVSLKNPTIEEVARNFLDKEAMEMNYLEAMERIETVKRNLMRTVKVKKFSKVTVFLVGTDKELEQGHFPSRGMMANIIGDELAQSLKSPAITMGYGKRNVNMRFNKSALDAGWSGADIVKAIRIELPNAMESGGGHPGAVSIRINKGFAKIVVEQLLKDIEIISNC